MLLWIKVMQQNGGKRLMGEHEKERVTVFVTLWISSSLWKCFMAVYV